MLSFGVAENMSFVLQTWGGEDTISSTKSWAAIGTIFRAPSTMTSCTLKLKQIWAQNSFPRLTLPDALAFGVTRPAYNLQLAMARSHEIVAVWPECVRWRRRRQQVHRGGWRGFLRRASRAIWGQAQVRSRASARVKAVVSRAIRQHFTLPLNEINRLPMWMQ
jgi:hypothetical protein